MADRHHHVPADTHEPRGTMDISDHVRTWHAFWNWSKWTVVALVILAFLLLMFRTNDGI